jgi:L-amino acid N-acyltransferase YncA
MIRKVRDTDATDICRIYNHYIENTLVTFEEEPLDANIMLQRIQTITKKYPWLVFENEALVLGMEFSTFLSSIWKSVLEKGYFCIDFK